MTTTETPAGDSIEGSEETLACDKCGENCFKAGWMLQSEDGEPRKSLCDDCFLICPNIKGAERCLKGVIKVQAPKKEKKPKAAKKKAPAAKVKRTAK